MRSGETTTDRTVTRKRHQGRIREAGKKGAVDSKAREVDKIYFGGS